jgi:LysR family cys regulon transcriptional activator
MTLRQLRALCEIVRHDLHLSNAAAALKMSQPGLSRQIQLLEDELGLAIFKRSRNRILGVTAAGQDILRFAELALRNTDNIRSVGRHLEDESAGNLLVATTYTHARYVLPAIIPAFARKYPNVRLEFWQSSPEKVIQFVQSGEADLAVVTSPDLHVKELAFLPFGTYHRVVVTPPKHPLLRQKRLTLEALAAYPIISYGFETSGWAKFNHDFEARGLAPNVVFRAVDADIGKKYVELGLGIAILPHIAYDAARDKPLRAIDASHLFEHHTMQLCINRDQFLRSYVYDFIEMLAPKFTRREVEKTLAAA